MSARRGFALVAALWLVVGVSLLALAIAADARPRRLAVANAAGHTAAVAAAEAALEETRARMDRFARTPFTPAAGQLARRSALAVESFGGAGRVDDFVYTATVRDPGALLDLNAATEEQLRALLAALRVDAARADRVVQGILDWRDGDVFRRPHGAERDDYLKAGSPSLPDDGPFTSLGTLRQVLGMTDAIYDRVRPYLTLVGGGRVNVNAAERPVLLTLPGMTEVAAQRALQLRQQGRRIDDLYAFGRELPPGAREQFLRALPLTQRLASTASTELLVTVDARLVDGASRARIVALVARDGGARVVWRRSEP